MELFHLSRVPNLAQLTPKVSENRLLGESSWPRISAAKWWWECAAMVPYRTEVIPCFLYRVIKPEEFRPCQGFFDANLEYQSFKPAEVEFLGELILSAEDRIKLNKFEQSNFEDYSIIELQDDGVWLQCVNWWEDDPRIFDVMLPVFPFRI